jgi:hypothetical protein
MNVSNDPHGASSLPEKRPVAGTYFDCGTVPAVSGIENSRLSLPRIRTSLFEFLRLAACLFLPLKLFSY